MKSILENVYFKNDKELVTLCDKLKDPCYFNGFLEVSIWDKDGLIKYLEPKLVKHEKELEHSNGKIKKLILGT